MGLRLRVMGFVVYGSEFRCWAGCWVKGLGVGFRVWGFNFRVQGFGCRVESSRFRALGWALGLEGPEFSGGG